MSRIVNDYVLELPELSIDTSMVSDEWLDKYKPSSPVQIYTEVPTEPVLLDLYNKINPDLLRSSLKFFIIKHPPHAKFGAHIDVGRFIGLNILLRGNPDKSPIKFYENQDFNSPVFEYYYKSYPVLLNVNPKYHSISNEDEDLERIMFCIYLKQNLTFQALVDLWQKDSNIIFNEKYKDYYNRSG